MKGFEYKKIVQGLNFFTIAKKSLNINKAIKLFWLTDRIHMRNYGRTVFSDVSIEYLLSEIKDLVQETNINEEKISYKKQYIKTVGSMFSSVSEFDDVYFSDTDIQTMAEVEKVFGNYTTQQLYEFSSNYPDSKLYDFENSKKSKNINFLLFFENPVENNHQIFNQSNERLEINKDVYLEHKEILDFFN